LTRWLTLGVMAGRPEPSLPDKRRLHKTANKWGQRLDAVADIGRYGWKA